MIGTAAYGFYNGDPWLLLTTWDYDGKLIDSITLIMPTLFSNFS
jgi:hypothetical protein